MAVEIKNLVITGSVRDSGKLSRLTDADYVRKEDLESVRRGILEDCRRLFKEQIRRANQR